MLMWHTEQSDNVCMPIITLLNWMLLLVLRQCLSHAIHSGRLPRNLRVARW